MKKLVVIGVTALTAMFIAVGVAPSAFAYPDTTCNVTVNAQKVQSGHELTVTGTATTTTTPKLAARAAAGGTVHWKATFNGQVHESDENTFVTTFKVPTVTTTRVFQLVVRALMPDMTTACQHTLDITVQPSGTSVTPPGGLPNTGGPRLILLIAGLALVVVGGGAIYTSRKRHDGHSV